MVRQRGVPACIGFGIRDAASAQRAAALADGVVVGSAIVAALEDGGPTKVFELVSDLNHTGAHKINNTLGQALLCQRMKKRRVIAETGAGQHGVATATACALLGLECVVYMGTEDIRRQRPNVERMDLLGATVVPVEARTSTGSRSPASVGMPWSASTVRRCW